MGRVSPFLSSPAHLPVPQLWRLKATISADFSGLGGGWGAPRWFLWPLWGQVTGVLTGSQRRIGWKDQAWPGVGVRRGSGFRDVWTAWRVLKGTLPNTLPRQCWLPGPSWGWRKCAQEWRPPPPPPEPRDGGCPGDLSRTHVSASSHQWEPEFGGGGMSLSSTINFPVEPKKEGVGAGRAGAQGGSPKPQSQRNSLGWSGSLFILSTGRGEMSSEKRAVCRSCWGGGSLLCSSGLFWKIPGGRRGTATWYLCTQPLLCSKIPSPSALGNAALFSFSLSLLHIFTGHFTC